MSGRCYPILSIVFSVLLNIERVFFEKINESFKVGFK